jgi:CheY-like chemotaxis protein
MMQLRSNMSPATVEPKRVLLVDDDEDTRESVAELLELLGHECATAGSGGEALSTLERFDPHVIFVDIGLPDMSGHELARAIRTLERPQVPIIAVSGRAQPADIARSLEHGIDLHLAKPIGYEALREIVGDAQPARSRAPSRGGARRPAWASSGPGGTARSARRGCR